MWRSKDDSQESVLSLHHESPRDQIQGCQAWQQGSLPTEQSCQLSEQWLCCAENFLAPPGIIHLIIHLIIQLSIPTAMTVMTTRNGGSGNLGKAELRSHRSEIHIRVSLTLKAHPSTVILFSKAAPKLGLSVGPRESRSLQCVSLHGAASEFRRCRCVSQLHPHRSPSDVPGIQYSCAVC